MAIRVRHKNSALARRLWQRILDEGSVPVYAHIPPDKVWICRTYNTPEMMDAWGGWSWSFEVLDNEYAFDKGAVGSMQPATKVVKAPKLEIWRNSVRGRQIHNADYEILCGT